MKRENICVEYEMLTFLAVTGRGTCCFALQGDTKTSNLKITPLEFTRSPCKLFFNWDYKWAQANTIPFYLSIIK